MPKLNNIKVCRLKFLFFMVIILLISLSFNTQVMRLATLPLQHKIIVGQSLNLGFENSPYFWHALQVNVKTNNSMSNLNLIDAIPVATMPGEIDLYFKLFGIIPLRQVTVKVVPQVKLLPGGQSIGVLISPRGLIVAGISRVAGKSGQQYHPADEAGIKAGDIILKLNNKLVETENQLQAIIAQYGQNNQPLTMQIKRKHKYITTKITPGYCYQTNRYRLGIFIKDTAAGVGTLTFYEPNLSLYGALGHVITCADTAQKIDMSSGRIVGASVQKIHLGQRGQPGEKVGILHSDGKITGNITQNTQYGIFGELSEPVSNPYYNQPIPVVLSSQIKSGPAKIITVVAGDKMQKFEINIEKPPHRSSFEEKGMVIKITDPQLLEITGGIIQGMSGSPIIQYQENGEPALVGAVTHVLINDPTRGYGVPLEWMLQEIKNAIMIDEKYFEKQAI